MPRGRFITFEGGEGAGKSTQLRAPRRPAARRPVLDVLTTREPGGTPGAEAIRELIVHGPAERWRPLERAATCSWPRATTISTAPSCRRWRAAAWVLCDRFADSTPGLPGPCRRARHRAGRRAAGAAPGRASARPDPAARPAGRGRPRALRRAAARMARFEAKGAAYHERVREGFLAARRARARALRRDRRRPARPQVAAERSGAPCRHAARLPRMSAELAAAGGQPAAARPRARPRRACCGPGHGPAAACLAAARPARRRQGHARLPLRPPPAGRRRPRARPPTIRPHPVFRMVASGAHPDLRVLRARHQPEDRQALQGDPGRSGARWPTTRCTRRRRAAGARCCWSTRPTSSTLPAPTRC